MESWLLDDATEDTDEERDDDDDDEQPEPVEWLRTERERDEDRDRKPDGEGDRGDAEHERERSGGVVALGVITGATVTRESSSSSSYAGTMSTTRGRARDLQATGESELSVMARRLTLSVCSSSARARRSSRPRFE